MEETEKFQVQKKRMSEFVSWHGIVQLTQTHANTKKPHIRAMAQDHTKVGTGWLIDDARVIN